MHPLKPQQQLRIEAVRKRKRSHKVRIRVTIYPRALLNAGLNTESKPADAAVETASGAGPTSGNDKAAEDTGKDENGK